MNHYDKVRETLRQLQNLRNDINGVIEQCVAELQREPVNMNITIEQLREKRIEMEELAQRKHRVEFRLDPEQALFDMKERLSKIIQEPPKQTD
tara:strand:- start:375 stop:653 length:279 start_codon:yes stop_codon:yes gene_type:complete